MNSKALQLIALTGLIAAGNLNLLAKQTASKAKHEAEVAVREAEVAAKDAKTREALKDTANDISNVASELKESATSRAKSASAHAKVARDVAAENIQAAGEAIADTARTAGDAVAVGAKNVRDRMVDSVAAVRETRLVTRTSTSDTERTGLTATTPQRYRIEIAFTGFEASEITITDHFDDSKPWIQIVGERKNRIARRAHGLNSSFFSVQRREVQRTLPPFVNVARGKYIKFIGDGVVAFEFELTEDAKENPNLLGLDTERISVTP